jgi:hypothetical protein
MTLTIRLLRTVEYVLSRGSTAYIKAYHSGKVPHLRQSTNCSARRTHSDEAISVDLTYVMLTFRKGRRESLVGNHVKACRELIQAMPSKRVKATATRRVVDICSCLGVVALYRWHTQIGTVTAGWSIAR